MEAFSALLAICAGNSPVPGEFPAQRPVTQSFNVFYVWINGWVNNREAGDLRRYRAHYDVTEMQLKQGLPETEHPHLSVGFEQWQPWRLMSSSGKQYTSPKY